MLNWYVREFQSNILSDAMTWYHADKHARDLSSTNDSGLAEVVTYHNNILFVEATYVRGKKRYQGLRANQAADKGLPPKL